MEPYTSTDWADEYQSWYSRIFRDIPRQAVRLHFFSALTSGRALAKDDLFDLETVLEKDPFQYLGYSVLRPFDPVTLAETVLASPPLKEGAPRLRCDAPFKVHLLGYELPVTGMPFMQQEGTVSVCAEADLWMLARYKHALGESRRFRPSEMEKIATQALKYNPTREGLTGEQMYSALLEMEFNPEYFYPADADHALGILDSYAGSGIPVVVAIGEDEPDHVATVVGFGYGRKANGLSKPNTVASRISSVLVHDDALGPYQVSKPKRLEPTDDFPERLALGDEGVFWCLVPLPPRVHLRARDVQETAEDWLKGSLTTLLRKRGWTKEELSQVRMRLRLIRSDKYKRNLGQAFKRGESELTEDVLARYWTMDMPRFVWVVDLLAPDDDPDGPSQGEMVFDSTAHFRDNHNSLLAFRLGGRFLYRTNRPLRPPQDAPVKDVRGWKFGHYGAQQEVGGGFPIAGTDRVAQQAGGRPVAKGKRI